MLMRFIGSVSKTSSVFCSFSIATDVAASWPAMIIRSIITMGIVVLVVSIVVTTTWGEASTTSPRMTDEELARAGASSSA